MSKIRLYVLLTIIIFSFQTLAKADDVSEFSIEGIQCLIDESALIRSIAKRRGRNAADYVNSQFITDALGLI